MHLHFCSPTWSEVTLNALRLMLTLLGVTTAFPQPVADKYLNGPRIFIFYGLYMYPHSRI